VILPVVVAWLFLTAETREIFRTVLQADDPTWVRGRGWALAFGLTALPYYQKTNPVLAGIARRAIQEVLADDQSRA
jgi:aminoglycoside phosphotransferase (APT) family kinase protein